MGSQDRKFFTAEGGEAGDPFAPMLFLLAMEPLHLLFKKAQECGLLGQLSPSCDACRVSLYADDAALFINPSKEELQVGNLRCYKFLHRLVDRAPTWPRPITSQSGVRE
jgi:hypothetical protein